MALVAKIPTNVQTFPMKGINTPRASPEPRRLCLLSRPNERGMDPYVAGTRSGEWSMPWSLSPRFVWHERLLPSPHVAGTRSGKWPLHGPFPLASFGMKGFFRHLTLPALARESGHCMAPFPSLRLAIKPLSLRPNGCNNFLQLPYKLL